MKKTADLMHYVYGGTFGIIIVVSLSEEPGGKTVLAAIALILILLAMLISGILNGKGPR